MRRPWTGRPSLSRGKSLSSDHTYPRRLIIASGLVLGSSYLATSIPTTFALDRPLHTVATVLLLSGLAIVAYETHAAKTRRPQNPSSRYVAIPLQEGNRRPSSEEAWPNEERPFHHHHHHALSPRALAVVLAALLCLLAARLAVFHAVIKDVECAGPQLTVRTRLCPMHSCSANPPAGLPSPSPRRLSCLQHSQRPFLAPADRLSRPFRALLPTRPHSLHSSFAPAGHQQLHRYPTHQRLTVHVHMPRLDLCRISRSQITAPWFSGRLHLGPTPLPLGRRRLVSVRKQLP